MKRYCSLENNIEWYNKVRVELDKHKFTNVDYRFVPPNDPSTLQKGGEWWTYKSCCDYIEEISNFNTTFDFILVDGFARNHCYLKSFNYLNKDGVLMIHDFYNLRKQDHLNLLWNFDILFKYYDVIMSSKTLKPRGNDFILLKKKLAVDYDPSDMDKFDTTIPRY